MSRPPPSIPTPSNSGPAPALCLVKIVAVHSDNPLRGYPANVNNAASLEYSGDVQTPSGPPVPFRSSTQRIRPESNIRWPSPWVVEAFKVGQILPAAMMDGKLYLTVREERWAAPCGWVPDTSGGGTPPPGGGVITPGPTNPPIAIGPGDGIAPIRENPRIFPDPIGPVPIGGGG
jgi:hypothetical protein